jgi:predicted permease
MLEVIGTVGQDVRYAVRFWCKSPGLSLAAIVSLALSVGAATAVFTCYDVVLLRPLPVHAPQQLFAVGPPGNDLNVSPRYFSHPFYRELRDNDTRFKDLIASSTAVSTGVNLQVGASTERVRAELVSGNYFRVLGVRAVLGRTFTEEDDRLVGGNPVVVLSHASWRRWFGARPDLVGQTIRLNGHSYTVIGVTGEDFFGTRVGLNPDLWAPLSMTAQMSGDTVSPTADNNYIELMLRLASPSDSGAVEGLATSAYRQWTKARGETGHAQVTLQLTPARRGLSLLRGQYGQALLILLSAVAVLFIIACANIGNLLLARGIARRREMAIRLSVGATPRRTARQLVTECLVLSVTGGLLGWCTSLIMGQALLSFLPAAGAESQFVPGGRVFLFTIGSVVLAGLGFGLAQARTAARLDLHQALTGHVIGHGVTSRRIDGQSLSSALQVALSLVLVIASVLFGRSLQNIRGVDTGFRRDHLLLLSLDPGKSGYSDARAALFYDTLLDSLRQQPGIRAAGLASYGSLSGVLPVGTRFLNTQMYPAGRPPQPGEDAMVWINIVSPGYLDAVATPLLQGRDFTARDRKGAPRVALVNETAARHFFGTENPIGQRIGYGAAAADIEVVGLVKDTKYLDLREEPRRIVYRPLAQETRSLMTLHINTAADPTATLSTVRREIRALDPSIPLFHIRTMRSRIDESTRQERLVATLASGLSVLGTLLAMVGLYAVVNYGVRRRTRELAVRMALGARPAGVVLAVLKRTLLIALSGIIVGLPATLLGMQVFEGFLFGIEPRDPPTVLVVTVLLVLLAVAAGYAPARRASRIDPMEALRQE